MASWHELACQVFMLMDGLLRLDPPGLIAYVRGAWLQWESLCITARAGQQDRGSIPRGSTISRSCLLISAAGFSYLMIIFASSGNMVTLIFIIRIKGEPTYGESTNWNEHQRSKRSIRPLWGKTIQGRTWQDHAIMDGRINHPTAHKWWNDPRSQDQHVSSRIQERQAASQMAWRP